MRHYASLWDQKYCAQGIALYESLRKHSSEPFTLHVLALDDETYRALKALSCSDLDVWKLKRFQERKGDWLLRSGGPNLRTYELGCIVDDSRSHAEFCWTMASQFTQWMLGWLHPGSNELTYLDADMMFFSDPAFIFDEIGRASIAVIPHRLISSKKHLEVNGKFNVSWVTLRGEVGRSCAARWAAQCRERCSAIVGCGDQAYLDEWPEKYGSELKAIENIGAGLAPWNLANYRIECDADGTLLAGVPKEGFWNWTKAVFYHYHEYIHGVRWTDYALRVEDINLVYRPYASAVDAARERIAESLLGSGQ